MGRRLNARVIREQTARFAVHVANQRSWSKHLPFFAAHCFAFFANSQAGQGVKVEGERFIVYELEKEDNCRKPQSTDDERLSGVIRVLGLLDQ